MGKLVHISMPTRIRIKTTGEVGTLMQVHYDFDEDGDLLTLRMLDGKDAQVSGSICEAVSVWVCGYENCTNRVAVAAGTDDEKKAEIEAAGWGPGLGAYNKFWCCPEHALPT